MEGGSVRAENTKRREGGKMRPEQGDSRKGRTRSRTRENRGKKENMGLKARASQEALSP